MIRLFSVALLVGILLTGCAGDNLNVVPFKAKDVQNYGTNAPRR
jgi:hypothetical protein